MRDEVPPTKLLNVLHRLHVDRLVEKVGRDALGPELLDKTDTLSLEGLTTEPTNKN